MTLISTKELPKIYGKSSVKQDGWYPLSILLVILPKVIVQQLMNVIPNLSFTKLTKLVDQWLMNAPIQKLKTLV